MERGVEVNDVPTAMLDDEEAVQQSKAIGNDRANSTRRPRSRSHQLRRRSAPVRPLFSSIGRTG